MDKFIKDRKYTRGTSAHIINSRIRSHEVRLIDSSGDNLGIVNTREALNRAREQELDLVIISEKANPPVAKILDYSKFLYEERKKQSSNKNKSSKSDTKEFIFGPSIGIGDLNVRIERTKEFLKEGNRVKMTVAFKGRENAHPEVGRQKIMQAIEALSDVAKIEEEPKLKGNLLTVTFTRK